MTDEKKQETPQIEEWEQPERMDDQQVVDMMTGAFNLDFVNVYKRSGRQIEALSLKGTVEAVNLRGGISLESLTYEYDPEIKAWRAVAWAKDIVTGVMRHGAYTQHVYTETTNTDTGEVTELYNEHAFTQALSKAGRNAYDAHLTEDVIRPVVEYYKQYLDPKTGKPNSAYWKKMNAEKGQSGSGQQQSGSGGQQSGNRQQQSQPPKTPEEQLKYARDTAQKLVADRGGLVTDSYGSKEAFWGFVGTKYGASEENPMTLEAWRDFNAGISNITRANMEPNREKLMKFIETPWADAKTTEEAPKAEEPEKPAEPPATEDDIPF